ncbi:MAG: glycosyltransferase family A protein [Eubacterium coprostanoligenes]|uniref:glycosyltransferase family A protein n=1 Tax=Eubacterium coprostanoligenes TaxID=290054 RepID=UPI0023F4D7AF|nr:glycosyltransferase family A protein [Eubacterium coprostanoligenes]MDD7358121.1 glycosyltransferase family A protein [Eubacterium coprostanoligenes]
MNKITVILPLYELCSDVKRAVLSIKRQSIGNEVELKIVDFRKFKAPKDYYKNKNGNVPDFVKTDKKVAKIKDIHEYLDDTGFDFEIVSADKEAPYTALNTATKSATGEYIIFLSQNCVFTKDIFEIMYTRAVEKNADILIANSIKQRGKQIEISPVATEVYKNDESKNFAENQSVLIKDNSIYNKLFKTDVVRSAEAEFSKFNTPRNIEFLTKIFASSSNIYFINRDAYLCDFKRFYEFEQTHNLEYNLECADSILRTVNIASKFTDKKYAKNLISSYISPLFENAQNSVNTELRAKCVEIHNTLASAYPDSKAVKELAKKYPVAERKNYNKMSVILSKTKHKIIH